MPVPQRKNVYGSDKEGHLMLHERYDTELKKQEELLSHKREIIEKKRFIFSRKRAIPCFLVQST